MVSPASTRSNSPEGIKPLKACKHNLCCFQASKKVQAAQSTISWKWGVIVERFHALLTKPITPTLYDPRDISRSSHHDSVFSFSPPLIYTFTVSSFICSGYTHFYTSVHNFVSFIFFLMLFCVTRKASSSVFPLHLRAFLKLPLNTWFFF